MDLMFVGSTNRFVTEEQYCYINNNNNNSWLAVLKNLQ